MVSRAVEHTAWWLWIGDDEPADVEITLRYEDVSPFEVALLFTATEVGLVVWCFARDLLAAGLGGHTGVGNVEVWPHPESGGVMLALHGYRPATGEMATDVFLAPHDHVAGFVDATLAMVPRGHESTFLADEIDDDLAGLFTTEEAP